MNNPLSFAWQGVFIVRKKKEIRMRNFRFEVGQTVVIHGCAIHSHCNGHVSTIVAREFRPKVRNRMTGELFLNVNVYRLAEMPTPLSCVPEEHLAPLVAV